MSLSNYEMINLSNSSNFILQNQLPFNKITISNNNDFMNSKPFVAGRFNILSKIKNTTDNFSAITSKTMCDLFQSLIDELNKFQDDIFDKDIPLCVTTECNIPLTVRLNSNNGKFLENHFIIYEELFSPYNQHIINPHITIPIDLMQCTSCNSIYDLKNDNENNFIDLFKPYKLPSKDRSLFMSEYADGGQYQSFMNEDKFLDNYISYTNIFNKNKPVNTSIQQHFGDNFKDFFITSVIHDTTQLTFSISAIEKYFPDFSLIDVHFLSHMNIHNTREAFNRISQTMLQSIFHVRKTDNSVKPEHYRYVYPDGKQVSIPNLGYQIVINDFSKSKINKNFDKIQLISNSEFIANCIMRVYNNILLEFNSKLKKDDFNFLYNFINNFSEFKNVNSLKWKDRRNITKYLKTYNNFKHKNTYGFMNIDLYNI